MKDLYIMMRRFVPPYKKFVVLNIICNILSALLTLFSFMLIIPILEMLFKVREGVYEYMTLGGGNSVKDVFINNFYYYTQEAIADYGPATTLAMLAAALVFITALKTGVT